MTTLLLITGPSGSGKSTAAAAWAARGTDPRAVIDADQLRTLIRAGFAHPEHGWTAETQRQWDVATELWRAMISIYRAHGINCAVDVYWPPCPSPGDVILKELGLQRIVLLPTLETCLRRNRVRNRQPLMTDDQIRDNYNDFAYCVLEAQADNVIDNSSLSVEATVDAVEDLVGG